MGGPSYIDPNLQVLIPSLQFNDSGHITAFHLAGACGGAVRNESGQFIPATGDNVSCISILQVWRPSGGSMFSIAANYTAALTVPFATQATTSVTVAEPIPFSSGDVLGFTPGPNTGLFFQIATIGQLASHTYYAYSSFAAELKATSSNKVMSYSPIISVEGIVASHNAAYAV